ncbi:MAG TPA: hypothetical protein VH374_20860 [Polyangia bacterium]|jgi:hypothetical protein|nr:hypothetical protein [Polyangia bacterium]
MPISSAQLTAIRPCTSAHDRTFEPFSSKEIVVNQGHLPALFSAHVTDRQTTSNKRGDDLVRSKTKVDRVAFAVSQRWSLTSFLLVAL